MSIAAYNTSLATEAEKLATKNGREEQERRAVISAQIEKNWLSDPTTIARIRQIDEAIDGIISTIAANVELPESKRQPFGELAAALATLRRVKNLLQNGHKLIEYRKQQFNGSLQHVGGDVHTGQQNTNDAHAARE